MIDYDSTFWKKKAFKLSLWGGGLFVPLTLVAMLVYPGGTIADPTTKGYSFFQNFFSELGFFTTKSGAANYFAAPLFFIAMVMAGASLVIFSLAFRQFFLGNQRQRFISGLGMLAGVLSGLCFIGVAFSPADILLTAHIIFVTWAFRLFPLSVLLYALVIFTHPNYPKLYGWLFIVFTLCLIGYIFLLEGGPSPADTRTAEVIQSAGQKIIVYISIIMVGIQSWGAERQILQKVQGKTGARQAA